VLQGLASEWKIFLIVFVTATELQHIAIRDFVLYVNKQRIEDGRKMIAHPKRTILIVDDDKAILRVFSRIFEKKGYAVSTAENGKQAKSKLMKTTYDATLLDIILPDIRGTELLPLMQKISPKMVKIVLTGLPSTEDCCKLAEKWADAFLSKPVSPEIIIELLEKKLYEKKT